MLSLYQRLFVDDPDAHFNALVADRDLIVVTPGDELSHFVLGLIAKRAVQHWRRLLGPAFLLRLIHVGTVPRVGRHAI